MDTVQHLNDKLLPENKTVHAEVDTRHRRHRKITLRDVSVLYGERPDDDRVWYLSPYEFECEWKVEMLKYPQTLAERNEPRNHAELTDCGVAKFEAKKEQHLDQFLIAGIDYAVKEEGGTSWMPYPDLPTTQHFRHTWVITKRPRPVAPLFIGAPVPQSVMTPLKDLL